MKITNLVCAASSLAVTPALASSCSAFPSSVVPFSSEFKQPEPPTVKSEFQTQFVQHKWNQNLSHITTGYIVNSPSKGFVRVDQANEDGFGTSLFNYANVTKDGLVDNILTMYTANSTTPDIWQGYVNSNFPIFQEDTLIQAGAVFSGLVKRTFWPEQVAAWDIMYQGAIPVTVFVNTRNMVVGYDYFAPAERTRVITKFFDLKA